MVSSPTSNLSNWTLFNPKTETITEKSAICWTGYLSATFEHLHHNHKHPNKSRVFIFPATRAAVLVRQITQNDHEKIYYSTYPTQKTKTTSGKNTTKRVKKRSCRLCRLNILKFNPTKKSKNISNKKSLNPFPLSTLVHDMFCLQHPLKPKSTHIGRYRTLPDSTVTASKESPVNTPKSHGLFFGGLDLMVNSPIHEGLW